MINSNSMCTFNDFFKYQQSLNLPRVMDLEHFMDSFLARLSNQVPSLCPPDARLANVLDFCKVFISMVLTSIRIVVTIFQ